MLLITKIFQFEMAHAIHGYSGCCQHIHGHSYELHVTVSSAATNEHYIPSPGFVIDFKELKKLIQYAIIEKVDHKLILSHQYLLENPELKSQKNLVNWDTEPTAENLLIYFQQVLQKSLPANITLIKLKLYETKNSYAEWITDKTRQTVKNI